LKFFYFRILIGNDSTMGQQTVTAKARELRQALDSSLSTGKAVNIEWPSLDQGFLPSQAMPCP